MTGLIERRCFALFLLLTVVVTSAAKASEAADGWIGLSRPELIRILSQATGDSPVTVETLEEYVIRHRALSNAGAQRSELVQRAERLKIETFEAAAKHAAPDTIWVMHGPTLPMWVTMVGNGEQIYSLQITVPVVNHSEPESARVFKALADLFSTVYPAWPDAAKWPGQSLKAAWDSHPLARQAPLVDPENVFIRHSLGGVTSTTYGVPPDIVVYNISAREGCVPVLTRGNPFQRIIC